MRVEDALVLEHGTVVGQVEAVDLVRDSGGDVVQAISQPVGQLRAGAQHAQRRLEVGARLRFALGGIGRRKLVDALVLEAVLGHEVLAHGPELGRVHGPRRAVALRVVLAVATALARLEPRH